MRILKLVIKQKHFNSSKGCRPYSLLKILESLSARVSNRFGRSRTEEFSTKMAFVSTTNSRKQCAITDTLDYTQTA